MQSVTCKWTDDMLRATAHTALKAADLKGNANCMASMQRSCCWGIKTHSDASADALIAVDQHPASACQGSREKSDCPWEMLQQIGDGQVGHIHEQMLCACSLYCCLHFW